MKRTFWDKHYLKINGGIVFLGSALFLSVCFSWWVACAFGVLVMAALFYNWLQSRIAKVRNPKDFAFTVFLSSAYKNPVRDRLKRHFPTMTNEEIDGWILEFEALQKEIGRLAAEGGEKILGKEFIVKTLQEKFPFLSGYGLKRALNQMWHAQFW
jgi:hypothetical protein